MKPCSKFFVFAGALLLATTALYAATPRIPAKAMSGLEGVLAQLDTASQRFKSAQANVSYDNYTRVVRDHALETGTLYIERSGKGESMGAIFFDPGPDGKAAKAPARVLSFDGTLFQMYTPGTNQDDVFKAGANQAKYDSFLTLGFGGSGHDLANAWTIQDQGAETIDGIKTEKLDLVSKDENVRSLFTHVTIWVDPARGLSLKQVFFAPNGDMRTALYSNIKLNASINKRPYAISKGATRIQH